MDLDNNGKKLSTCSSMAEKEPEIEMNVFYRLSGQNRSRRTSYNINFSPIKQDLQQTRTKWPHSTNGSLQNILYPFDSNDRPRIVPKSKGKLSITDRYRIMNKNSNYRKETNNLSVKDLELLQQKNSLMLNSLKQNF